MHTNIFTNKLQKLQAGVSLVGINTVQFTTPVLAVADLKQSFGKGLGIVMMLSFIFGLIKIITGAVAISNGNPEGIRHFGRPYDSRGADYYVCAL
jgi:hypothetical protein